MRLARYVASDDKRLGGLVVCPNASGTIRRDLKHDIEHIASGKDDLSDIADEFLRRLKDAGLDSRRVCARLRIIAVDAVGEDGAHVAAAREMLATICLENALADDAWAHLRQYGRQMIRSRRRASPSDLARLLRSKNIALSNDPESGPAAVCDMLVERALRTYQQFEIPMVQRALSLKRDWLPLAAFIDENEIGDGAPKALEEALKEYHERPSRRRGEGQIEALSIGMFRRRCVVRAGPGMGKSVFAKRLALAYAEHGIPVFVINLRALAARMKNGDGAAEAFFALAFDGARGEPARADFSGWTFICDGLDEMDVYQGTFAEALSALAAEHPAARFIVTTRPVGYETALLRTWRHYWIDGIAKDSALDCVTTLLEGLYADDEEGLASAAAFAEDEMRESAAAKLADKSPFLAALTASLIYHRRPLGRTKADFMKSVIDLFCARRTERSSGDETDPATLLAFIHRLGWDIAVTPLRTRDELLTACGEQLSEKLGVPTLAGRREAETCLARCEAVGLVESIRHAGASTLTFVHKQFAEYAAAAHVCAQPLPQRRDFIAQCVAERKLEEVVDFLCARGLRDEVLAAYADTIANGDNDEGDVESALHLCASWPAAVLPAECGTIIDKAIEMISGPHRGRAYRVGKSLAAIARQLPEETSLRIADLRESEHVWTRAIAWLCCLQRGEPVGDPETLAAELPLFAGDKGAGWYGTSLRHAAFSFHESSADVIGVLLLQCAKALLSVSLSETTARMIEGVIADTRAVEDPFHGEMAKIFSEHGQTLNWPAPESIADMARGLLTETEEFRDGIVTHWRTLLKGLAGALGEPMDESDSDAEMPMRALMHLGALLGPIQFSHCAHYDALDSSAPPSPEIAERLASGLLVASKIDTDALRKEIPALLRILDDMEESGRRAPGIFLTDVDPAEPDWARAKAIFPDPDELLSVIGHEAQWAALIAAHIVDGGLDRKAAPDTIRRVWRLDSVFARRVGAAMACDLDRATAISLLIEDIRKGVSYGCERHFTALAELKSKRDEIPIDVVRAGLLCRPIKVAEAAAEFTATIAKEGDGELFDLLVEAYDHWSKTEPPRPKGDGRVPDTARPAILKAMRRAGVIPDRILLAASTDDHGDVRKEAGDEFVARMPRSEALRAMWIDALKAGTALPHQLSTLLNADTPFSEEQITYIKSLLSHETAEWRRAAMSVLKNPYAAPEEIRDWLARLLCDADNKVRDLAIDRQRSA